MPTFYWLKMPHAQGIGPFVVAPTLQPDCRLTAIGPLSPTTSWIDNHTTLLHARSRTPLKLANQADVRRSLARYAFHGDAQLKMGREIDRL